MPSRQSRQADSRPTTPPPPQTPRLVGRSPATEGAPRGQRIERNVGPGTLYPGVGQMVQRTGLPHRAGSIAGQVFAYTEGPNSRDPKRISTRLIGQFIGVTHKGEVLTAHEAFLPEMVTRPVKAAIDAGSIPVPVSHEWWCEPDDPTKPRSALGYTWRGYDLRARTPNDPLFALAIETGLIEAPAPAALPAPESELTEGRTVDPETGEILPAAADTQAA